MKEEKKSDPQCKQEFKLTDFNSIQSNYFGIIKI